VSNDPEREDAMNRVLVDELKRKLEESNANMKQLELKNEELLKEAGLTKAKTDTMVQVIEDTETKHRETVDKCRKENESLKIEITQSTFQNSALSDELSAKSSEKVGLESRVETANSEILYLQSLNESLVIERDGANARVDELTSEMQDAKKAFSSLKSEKDGLASSLEDYRHYYDEIALLKATLKNSKPIDAVDLTKSETGLNCNDNPADHTGKVESVPKSNLAIQLEQNQAMVQVKREKKDTESALENVRDDLDISNDTLTQLTVFLDFWQSKFDELASLAAAGGVDGSKISIIRRRLFPSRP